MDTPPQLEPDAIPPTESTDSVGDILNTGTDSKLEGEAPITRPVRGTKPDLGHRATVIAAAVSALIGGLFGLSGTYFVYSQSQQAIEVSKRMIDVGQTNRLADEKRAAYSAFLQKVAEVRSVFLSSDDRVEAGQEPEPEEIKKVKDAYAGLQEPLYRLYMTSPGEVSQRALAVDKAFLSWSAEIAGTPMVANSAARRESSSVGRGSVPYTAGRPNELLARAIGEFIAAAQRSVGPS